MRILVISYMYPNPTNEILGIFVEEQVKALVKQGCEVKVIAPVAYCPFPFNKISKRWRQSSNIPFWELRNGVEVYHPRYITTAPSLIGEVLIHLHGWLVYRGIKKLMTKIVSDFKPEIIHSHGVFPIGYTIALLKKHFRESIKTVITAHGGDMHSLPFRNNLFKKVVILSLSNNDVVITVSQHLKNMAKSLLDGTKIRVIPNGVDIDKFKMSSEDLKWVEEKKSNFSEKKILLFVGNSLKLKGARELLEAFERISASRSNLSLFLISSDKKNSFLDPYMNKLNGKVSLIGPVKHEQIKLWLNLCDIFLLPSYKEGLPVAMLEAMACGKPVIVSDVGGISEVIRNNENGLLIQPRDVDSLVQAINLLLDNPEEARKVGEKARETILRNYTWAKNAVRTIEVYREVLGWSQLS